MTDLFRSLRLTYRAVETPDDEPFFRTLIYDRVGYQNSNLTNIRLGSKKDAQDYLKFCAEDCFLGAVIMLPESSEQPLNKSGPVRIGEIHLKAAGKDRQHHRGSEIGLQILPEYQGKGYGTEAIRWALDYAFRQAGLHRVGIKAHEWNVGALKLYEKCGFVVEGREREALWHDGRWWDAMTMGLLESEWRKLREEEGGEIKSV